ncbi:MAG: hypothetical protein ACTSO9_04355 [Candidatus Helarchaeota archaeon]
MNIQIIFVIFLILFLNLVSRAYKQGDYLAGIYKIGLAGFFLCNAINFVFRFLDFYYPSFFHVELLIYSRITIMIGVTFLLASLELSKMLETRGFLTISFAISTILINIIAASSGIVTIISSLIHIIIPVIYFYFAIEEKGIVKYQIFFNGLGILFILLGSTLRPSDIRPLFPNAIRLFEDIFPVPFEIVPYALAYLGLLLIMIFDIDFMTKIRWPEKIRSVYLISNSGTLILERYFKDEKIPFEELPKMGLDTNKILKIKTKWMMPTRVDIGDKKIFIEHGAYLTGILIADEKYRVLSKKLSEYIKDVEELFRDILPKWDGTNLKLFEPAKVLINRHLTTAEETMIG